MYFIYEFLFTFLFKQCTGKSDLVVWKQKSKSKSVKLKHFIKRLL